MVLREAERGEKCAGQAQRKSEQDARVGQTGLEIVIRSHGDVVARAVRNPRVTKIRIVIRDRSGRVPVRRQGSAMPIWISHFTNEMPMLLILVA